MARISSLAYRMRILAKAVIILPDKMKALQHFSTPPGFARRLVSRSASLRIAEVRVS